MGLYCHWFSTLPSSVCVCVRVCECVCIKVGLRMWRISGGWKQYKNYSYQLRFDKANIKSKLQHFLWTTELHDLLNCLLIVNIIYCACNW